jgi:hypothetical protein
MEDKFSLLLSQVVHVHHSISVRSFGWHGRIQGIQHISFQKYTTDFSRGRQYI